MEVSNLEMRLREVCADISGALRTLLGTKYYKAHLNTPKNGNRCNRITKERRQNQHGASK